MKKLFTFITLCLFTVMSAMAADTYTSVYSKALTDWTSDDLTAWSAASNVGINATNGIGVNANQTATYVSKTFGIEKNSKIKYNVTWAFGTATGRTSNYNHINFGSIRIAVNSSYNVYLSADGGATWNATTLGYYYNQTKSAVITLTIDSSNGAVEEFTFDGTDRKSLLSTATVTNAATVSTGFIRGGSVSWGLDNFIKSIEVSECKQTVTTADYTINYLFESTNIKTVNGNTTVGSTVNAESPITIEGQKYYAVDDATTSMEVTSTASNNVLNVNLRKAGEWNWTVKSSVNTTLATGVCTEGGSFTVAIPRYIDVDGTLYETAKGSDWYHKTYTITQDNQVETITYSATSITNVVLYAEAEDLAGATAGNGNGSRTSMGLTGYGTNLPVGALAPGKYKIYMHAANGNSAARAVSFNDGETALAQFTIAGSNNSQDFESSEFTVTNPADVTLTSEGSSASGVDYIYIVKTGEASMSPAINADGFGTFSAAFPAKIEGAKVYTATLNLAEGKIVATEVESGIVPAGKGVILVKDGETVTATYTAEEANEAAFEANELVATTNADGSLAEVQNKALVLSGKTFKTYTGGALAANKAYFEYAENEAKTAFSIIFSDEEATAADVVVAQPVKAVVPVKYIKNGQVIIGNVNAAAQQVK